MYAVVRIALALALLLAAWLVWRMLRPRLVARSAERARREFDLQRDTLESTFLERAGTSGKPRGLAWKSCAFQDALLMAHDRANGELIGLVGVTIAFEAIEGGGMEEVEAVDNLRAATAVFMHNGREWTTTGRVIFNLEPHEVLQRYPDNLVAVAANS